MLPASHDGASFGTGELAQIVCTAIGYLPGTSGPRTLVVKFAASDPASLKSSGAQRV